METAVTDDVKVGRLADFDFWCYIQQMVEEINSLIESILFFSSNNICNDSSRCSSDGGSNK